MSDHFEDAVRQLAEQVQDIGYEDVEIEQLQTSQPSESDGDNDATPDEAVPERFVILVETTAGPDFVLLASEDERYVEVQSTYSLWHDIAEEISEDHAIELVPDEVLDDLSDDHPINDLLYVEEIEDREVLRRPVAALELLEQADKEVRKEIVYQLSEIFTNAEVKHVVDSPSETGAPHGFNVYYKIFPFEDSFTLDELNSTVERVRMAAHRGTLFLRYAFNLGVDISRTTSGNLKADPKPPSRDTMADEIFGSGIEDLDQ